MTVHSRYELPDEFTCPISADTMLRPVHSPCCKYVWDKASVENTLNAGQETSPYLRPPEGYLKCPQCRVESHIDSFLPDITLQRKVQLHVNANFSYYKKYYGQLLKEAYPKLEEEKTDIAKKLSLHAYSSTQLWMKIGSTIACIAIAAIAGFTSLLASFFAMPAILISLIFISRTIVSLRNKKEHEKLLKIQQSLFIGSLEDSIETDSRMSFFRPQEIPELKDCFPEYSISQPAIFKTSSFFTNFFSSCEDFLAKMV
jgi:hypothetical protein